MASRVLGELEKVMVGDTEELKLLLVTLLAGGHALIEGPLGVGKTLIAYEQSRSQSGHRRPGQPR